MSEDWTCDSCTFINSNLLAHCEICGATKSGPGPGPSAGNDPIVLSDGDDDAIIPLNNQDVIDLADDGDYATAHHRDADVTILDDDDDDDDVGPSGVVDLTSAIPAQRRRRTHQPAMNQQAQPRHGAGRSQESAPAGAKAPPGASSGDNVFTLDTCSCIQPLSAFVDQLQTAVAAATAAAAAQSAAITATPPAGVPSSNPQAHGRGTAASAGEVAAAPGVTAATPTLLDLAAPLVCPSAGCRRWMSSRDVRLLLGPYATHTLHYAMCTALRREAKAAKLAAQRQQRESGSKAKDAEPSKSAPAAPAAAVAAAPTSGRRGGGGGRRGGRGGRGGGGAGTSAANGSGAAAGAAAGGASSRDAVEKLPLQPLAPSCPTCRTRMLHVAALTDQPPAPPPPPTSCPPPPPSSPPPQPQPPASPLQRSPRTRRQTASLQQQHHQQPHNRNGGAPEQRTVPGIAASALPATLGAAPSAAGAGQQGQGQGPLQQLLQPARLCTALQVRGHTPACGGAAAASAAAGGVGQLCRQLREVVGPRCAFLCLGCPYVVEEGALLPAAEMQELQCEAEGASHALRLLRRVRAVLLSAREDDDGEEDGEDEGEGAAAGAGTQATAAQRGGRGGGSSGGRKRSRGHGGGQAWAKGVGYGGGGPYGGHGYGGEGDKAAVQAARMRQKQADEEMRSCLSALLDIMAPRGRTSAPGGGGAGGDGRAISALASPSPLLLATLQYGGLPYVLRLLLQNDSLLDMGQRQQLYGVVLAIVRRCASSMSLLELLVVPATDPRDATAPAGRPPSLPAGAATGPGPSGAGAAAAGPGPGPGPGSPNTDPPLSTVFESLVRQCSVFKRAAQELADGAEEDIAALGLALELGAVAEEVAAGVRMWQGSMEGATGILSTRLQQSGAFAAAAAAGPRGTANSAADAAGQAGGGRGGGGAAGGGADLPPAKRTRRRSAAAAGPEAPSGGGAAAGASAPAEAEAAAAAASSSALAARRSEYLAAMRPLQFREVPLMEDHYFRRQAELPGSAAGGEVMRQRLKRITGEISGLATGLPLDWDAAAFVAVDENRVDILRALLIPASDTPYANGPFIFDIYLPPNYPNVPPQVQFLTTGGGKVRFNPNLYAEGKVCLSLLGTWSGPSWDPTMSTILQVLVSIQSMILVSDPYYNEPGWEHQAGTPAGRQAASAYANSQRYNTLAFSILPALQMLASTSKSNALSGGSTFRDVLHRHFKIKTPELLRQCDDWLADITLRATAAAGAGGSGVAQQSMTIKHTAQLGGQMATGQGAMAASGQETLRKYTEQVVPQIKDLLQRL